MAIYIVQDASLAAVADAIRAKAGITEPLVFPDGYTAAVDGIQTSGGTVGGGDGSPFMVEKVVNIGADVSVTAKDYIE